MITDLENNKDQVEHILKTYPDTRDNDKLLWLAYLCVFQNLQDVLGTNHYLALKDLVLKEDTATMESITRLRRKFQEAGQYQGKNRAKRIEEASKVREWSNSQKSFEL